MEGKSIDRKTVAPDKRNQHLGRLPLWVAYVSSVALTLLTLILRMEMTVDFGERPLLILFVLPIILSAYVGGVGPGLLATVLAALSVKYFLIPHVHTLDFEEMHDFVQWATLIMNGVLISVLNEALHRSRYRAELSRLLQAVGYSEKKKAEAALRESEERFKLLYERAPLAYQSLDENGAFLEVNKAWLDTLGYEREEVIGRSFGDFLHPDWIDHFKENFPRFKAVGEVLGVEFEMVKKDGSTILVCFHGKIGRDSLGHFEQTHCIFQNITDRKRAEEALRSSEEKFRTAFRTSPDSINLNRLSDGMYLDINEGFTKIMGYTREETIGKTSFELEIWDDPKDRERLVAALGRNGFVENLEARFRGKDGRIRIGLMSARVLHLNHENVILSITRDITERKQVEEENRKLEAQLRQAQRMESVGRLAGGVAHDFNNMLGVILGYTELALADTDPAQPIFKDLQEVHKAAQRSADLTRQLLAFARKQTISPKILDVNETVEGMLKMLRRLIGEDIHLAWLPGAGLWPVKMDPSQIDQVLANLCVNARDAIAGLGTITIETGNVAFDERYCASHMDFGPGKYVMLAVSDDGCGMDKEILDQVFEPFFTTKEMGRGTGLGMATVYGIVKQNDGFINIYSEPGKGTTIKIYFRCADVPVSEDHCLPGQKKDLQGTETILLVEDEEPFLALGKTILKPYGYNVLAAHNPVEAIELAQSLSGPIHLLIIDLIMPGMNGKDLGEKLWSIKPGFKCIYMSGYTANIIAHHGVLDEGIHFLQKPFSPKAMAEMVREVLDA